MIQWVEIACTGAVLLIGLGLLIFCSFVLLEMGINKVLKVTGFGALMVAYAFDRAGRERASKEVQRQKNRKTVNEYPEVDP